MFPRHTAEMVGGVSFEGNWPRPRDAGSRKEAPSGAGVFTAVQLIISEHFLFSKQH